MPNNSPGGYDGAMFRLLAIGRARGRGRGMQIMSCCSSGWCAVVSGAAATNRCEYSSWCWLGGWRCTVGLAGTLWSPPHQRFRDYRYTLSTHYIAGHLLARSNTMFQKYLTFLTSCLLPIFSQFALDFDFRISSGR